MKYSIFMHLQRFFNAHTRPKVYTIQIETGQSVSKQNSILFFPFFLCRYITNKGICAVLLLVSCILLLESFTKIFSWITCSKGKNMLIQQIIWKSMWYTFKYGNFYWRIFFSLFFLLKHITKLFCLIRNKKINSLFIWHECVRKVLNWHLDDLCVCVCFSRNNHVRSLFFYFFKIKTHTFTRHATNVRRVINIWSLYSSVWIGKKFCSHLCMLGIYWLSFQYKNNQNCIKENKKMNKISQGPIKNRGIKEKRWECPWRKESRDLSAFHW